MSESGDGALVALRSQTGIALIADTRTFLSDAGRKVQKDLDIQEYTDPHYDPMIPHTFVLKPGLVIYSVYNGYLFWGRPSFEDLRRDLREVTREIRPDWDLAAPGLRQNWEAGDHSRHHPYRQADHGPSTSDPGHGERRGQSRRCLTMEYLVTMTTHVPDGTADQAVQDIRAREAAHSRELAAQGHLLRLWRPPLQPGEWRTLGLFAAADGGRLEEVLASMPLRIWRTDEVTPLAPHRNDPAPTGAEQKAAEFLVTFTPAVPPGTAAQAVEDARAREAQAAHDLAAQGHLLRLWALPGAERALGLYQARDAAQMEAILEALPLAPWMTMDTTPLSPHPSDPAIIHPPATAAGTP